MQRKACSNNEEIERMNSLGTMHKQENAKNIPMLFIQANHILLNDAMRWNFREKHKNSGGP
jgi:hypothetical protein